MPITYSTELKVKTIRRYEKGESIKALSQELHISQSTLYQWRKEYCSIKTPNHTYTPAEFDAISRHLQKLEHHMEIIRQTEYLSNIPLQKKLATLEELYHRPGNPFSVHELCDALDVARGTFYNHVFRKADRSQYQEEQAQLMLKVKQVFDDSEQRFGAEKIRIVLAESGIRVGKKRISAIMQGVFGRASKSDMGQRYYILQGQKLLGLSLYHSGSILPQGYRLAGIKAYEYTSGHRNLQNHLSGARETAEPDLSQ